MSRAEFMRRLTELLGDVSPTEREEAIQYYNDYFEDAGEENESSVIASLGTPEELARTIKAGLSDGGNGGEFTETGFSGFTQAPKDELIKADDTDAGRRSGDDSTWTSGTYHGNAHSAQHSGSEYGNSEHNNSEYSGSGYSDSQTGNSYYDGAYYKRPEGEGVYGGRKDTRSHNNPYGQNRTRSDDPYGSGGGSAQNGSGTQNTAYRYDNTKYKSSGNASAGKENMSGGMIALIVILAVLTSPVWLGLLGGLFGLAVGVLATVFAVFLVFLIIGVVFVAVSVALFVTGISLMLSIPAGGLCLLGCALALFGLGLLSIWLMIVIAGTAIPACVRGIASLCRKIFHRGGAWA